MEVALMSLDIMRQALLAESEALVSLAATLDDRHQMAIDWVLGCSGRVITCGIGKSGHIARKTAGTLSSTGTPSLFLHAAEATHGDLGMITPNDIVLLYSHSGETDEIVTLFPAIKSIGAKTMIMTGRPESSAGRAADLVLCTGVREEACPNNLAPTTSTTAMLALSDAIAIAVMVRREFKREDFAKFHPSGALGKRLLLRVEDVMRAGSDLATVTAEASSIDVMKAMTQAGAGAAIVVSPDARLIGLITDGDLRRHFLQSLNPLDATAEELMTRNPMTLEPHLLAIEALEFFQNLNQKIGEIPVVQDGQVQGLLVLKDLLRSGIV